MPAAGQPGSKISFPIDASRSRTCRHGDPIFFHTFQRRSNRDPAIVLERSMGRDEICVKGKSFMTPISIEPMGAANDRPPQSETSWYSAIGWLSSWLASLAA